jgi:hypothetical protein
VEKCGRDVKTTDGIIKRPMRFACWITKATHTHTEYVILLAFALQLWLCERASTAVYRYIACLVEAVVAIKIQSCRSFASIKKLHT